MTERIDQPIPDAPAVVPLAPDAETGPTADPMPIPGAAGPMGGSPTGDLVDGVGQPVEGPGSRPPLTTDAR